MSGAVATLSWLKCIVLLAAARLHSITNAYGEHLSEVVS
jgi:hypothetical protein